MLQNLPLTSYSYSCRMLSTHADNDDHDDDASVEERISFVDTNGLSP